MDTPVANVEFLAYAGAQDANEMIGVFAQQRRVVSENFVGDPAAAGHGSCLAR